MTEKKRNNILKAIEDAERKIQSLSQNNLQQYEKISKINSQIAANKAKIQKLNFFLEQNKALLENEGN